MKSNAQEILKKVKKIEIATRKIVDTVLSGQYHTRFRGLGMQFSDFREYEPGDDIRHIDWKVTARTQYAHIKKFEEERDLTVYILVDVSSSNHFGSISKLKKDVMAEVAALLAFAAVKNNDRVGLMLFSNEVIKHLPAKKGKSHALRIVSEILHQDKKYHSTNIKNALEHLNKNLKHSSVVLLISDFYDEGYEKALRKLAIKHDVIGIRVVDPIEKNNFNFNAKIFSLDVQDAESGKTYNLDLNSYAYLDGLKKNKLKFEKNFQSIFDNAGIDRLDVLTSEDYFKTIALWFKLRKHKR
jgi:uncharacterized protein (DUF58 family)